MCKLVRYITYMCMVYNVKPDRLMNDASSVLFEPGVVFAADQTLEREEDLGSFLSKVTRRKEKAKNSTTVWLIDQ